MALDEVLTDPKNRNILYGANVVGSFVPLTTHYANGISSATALTANYLIKDRDWKIAAYTTAGVISILDFLGGIDIKNTIGGNLQMAVESGVDALTAFALYKDLAAATGNRVVGSIKTSFVNLYQRYLNK
ncbi:MAG: hypothetical protein QW594_03070 [Candidatus Woesearchaeota archaeon]